MSIIVAIGGYKRGRTKDTAFDTPLKIDRQIVELTGKQKPKALFIPTASSDDAGYVRAIHEVYGEKLGCTMDVLRLIAEKPTHAEIAAKIRWAELIYVGGGNTLMMMNLWRRLGVDKLLKEAYERGAVCCGVSAGSICWFEYGVSDSRQFKNKSSHEYIRVKGLGILKGMHCPHYDPVPSKENWRLKGAEKLLKKFPKGKFIPIRDGEAVVFRDGVEV
ncbi:MAG: peptidase E [Patescibacteria group bacterium]